MDKFKNNQKLYIHNLNYKTNNMIKSISVRKKLISKSNKELYNIKNNRYININIDNKTKNNKSLLYKTIQIKNNNNIINQYFFNSILPINRRVKSCIQYYHRIYKNLNIDISKVNNEENSLNYNKCSSNSNNNNKIEYNHTDRLKSSNIYNAYYYSGNFPIKNKYIIDSLCQSKYITSYSFKKPNITDTYKKIDQIAKNLSLFHNKRQLFKDEPIYTKNLKNYFSEKLLKIHNKGYLSNTNINNKNNSNKTYFKNSINNRYSVLGEISHIKDPAKIKINENEKLIFRNKKFKFVEDKINQTNKYESDYLYKKIFQYNNENKKRKSLNVIDNKLNLFYSENEDQYNQKIKKINENLYKKGKPIKHFVISENAKINTPYLIKRVKFMKKVVDYLYPNMVLAKVREENKRISKTKSISHKMPLSKLILLEKKRQQKNLELFLGKSFSFIK